MKKQKRYSSYFIIQFNVECADFKDTKNEINFFELQKDLEYIKNKQFEIKKKNIQIKNANDTEEEKSENPSKKKKVTHQIEKTLINAESFEKKEEIKIRFPLESSNECLTPKNELINHDEQGIISNPSAKEAIEKASKVEGAPPNDNNNNKKNITQNSDKKKVIYLKIFIKIH
jgi:hypothetical protein